MSSYFGATSSLINPTQAIQGCYKSCYHWILCWIPLAQPFWAQQGNCPILVGQRCRTPTVHGWQFHCHTTCPQYRTAAIGTNAYHSHNSCHPLVDSRYYTEFGQTVFHLSQHWLKQRTRMAPCSGGLPGLYVAKSFGHAGRPVPFQLLHLPPIWLAL